MLSFSELEFKWSVHVIDALNHQYLISLQFTMIYVYHGSDECEKLAMLPQNMAIYILKYVLQCTNEKWPL